MDLVIVRESTEGFYPDRNMVAGSGEFMPTEDIALSVRKITAFACRRIAGSTFARARARRQAREHLGGDLGWWREQGPAPAQRPTTSSGSQVTSGGKAIVSARTTRMGR